MLEIGTKAPAFTLPDQNGNMRSLADYQGQKVILYFYPKDMTAGCTKQACAFGDLYPQFREKGAVVLGVSKDSVASHKKFEEKYGLPFALLSDPEKEVIQAYDVWKEKKNYGKVSMGVVRTTYLIDENGIIIKAFDKVKAADNPATDTFTCTEVPVFIEKTGILKDWISGLSYEEQKTLWACNDKIAKQNAERFSDMDLHRNLTPALLAYDGIQYTYMAPAVFEDGQFDYVQEHLRILSGFYGVVKPMDGVVPYRLEMQAKAAVAGYRNLYDFWGDDLYREVMDDSRVLINLASKEYSKCIEKYLQPEDRYITCVFGELEGGKVVQKGVYAKMARGEMVRFMAGIHVDEPEQIKTFNWSGYHFDESRSSDTEYVFIRTEIPGKK